MKKTFKLVLNQQFIHILFIVGFPTAVAGILGIMGFFPFLSEALSLCIFGTGIAGTLFIFGLGAIVKGFSLFNRYLSMIKIDGVLNNLVLGRQCCIYSLFGLLISIIGGGFTALIWFAYFNSWFIVQ